jgi:RHS repeat-associated protein
MRRNPISTITDVRPSLLHRRHWLRRMALLLAPAAVIGGGSFFPVTGIGASPTAKTAQASSPSPKADVFIPPATTNRTPVGGAPTFQFAPPAKTSVAPVLVSRTQTSDTYKKSAGTFSTVISPGSLNYKDASGSFQPINDTLVADASPANGWHNAANRYRVELPTNLGSSPVTVTSGQDSLSFAPEGASGSVSVSGSSAAASDVLPGVNLAYTASPDSLVETIDLTGASSPASIPFAVTASSGITASETTSGGIAFNGTSGAIFGFAPPTVRDANGAAGTASMTLATSPSGWVVTVNVDPAWLAASGRAFPVTIDPTTLFYVNSDEVADSSCYLEGGSFASTNFCSSANVDVGYDGTEASRGLLTFNVANSIQTNADILNAQLGLYVNATSNSTALSLSLNQATSASNSNATWNNRKTATPWTTAGGDFVSTPADTRTQSATTGWQYFYPTQLVQNWLDGAAVNDGVFIKETTESTNNVFSYYSDNAGGTHAADYPELTVDWQEWLGSQPMYSNYTHQLTDRSGLSVNVANGNLVVQTQDEQVAGTGLDLDLGRTFNGLSGVGNAIANQWTLDAGQDIGLYTFADGSIDFYGPDGLQAPFILPAGGTAYTSPSWLPVTLVKLGGGSYQLTFNRSGEKYLFSSGGVLSSLQDKNGNAITYNYTGTNLTSITDTQGRVTTVSYDSNGYIKQLTDSSSRTYKYSTNGSTGNLTSYTDPAGKITSYTYNSNYDLTKIVDPLGNIVVIGYNSSSEVTSVKYVTNNTTLAGLTYSFAYNSGNTVITDPSSHTTTYYIAPTSTALESPRQVEVTKVLDGVGHQVDKTYSPNSNVATIGDGTNMASLSYSTDGNDNLDQIAAPPSASGQTGASSTLGYLASGLPYYASSATDPSGNCTATGYDSSGNLTSVRSGLTSPCDNATTGGSVATSTYQGETGVNCGPSGAATKAGSLCSTTDGNGHTTTYTYDTEGNLTKITPPSPQGATTITIDSQSRVTEVVEGNGLQTNYFYDALNRTTEITYNGDTGCTSTSTCTTPVYDADGNRTSITDNSGTTSYVYDTLNRLTDQFDIAHDDACGTNPGIHLTYDAASNLSTYCNANGTTTYGYDAANEVTSLAEPGGSCTGTVSLCTTFAYNSDGDRTTTTFPGSATLTSGFDNAGNETSIVGSSSTPSTLTSFTYAYAVGTADKAIVQSVTDAHASTTTSYGYNALDQLTSAATSPGSTLDYSYDGAGNRCSTTTSCSSPTYTYNSANQLTSGPAGSYTYDNSGQETSSPQLSNLTENAKDQTTAVTPSGSSAEALTYNGTGQFLLTGDGSTAITTGPVGLDSSTTAGTTTYYVFDPQGNILGEEVGSTHYYYLKDRLGSVVAVINGSGSTVSNRYAYDPYGNVTSSSGSVANNIGFDGGWQDSITGLEKFGTRWYDASTGRWTQPDPVVANDAASSGYAFAGDDPVNLVDGTGELTTAQTVGIGIFLAGVTIAGGGVFILGAGALPSAFLGADFLSNLGLGVGAGGIVISVVGGITSAIASLF